MTDPKQLPFLAPSLPGISGRIKETVEDFRVDERPAYEPSGEGDHVFAVIRKRGLSTYEAIAQLAGALKVRDADVGCAGLKDKQGVTTQQLSFPPPVRPEDVTALAVTMEADGLEVLSAVRHPHKLRTGHLRANAFAIVVRECDVEEEEAAVRAAAILAELGRAPGMANWFGEQRFGAHGDNASRGAALLRGEVSGRKPKPRVLRLLLSSIQSLLFNDYLTARIVGETYREVLAGDILKKTDTGGVFATEDLAQDQARLAEGAVVATGPMFGPKMRRPDDGTAAADLEGAVLAARDLEHEAFSRFARLTPGTRRPLSFALTETCVKPIGPRAIEVSFTLPSGSYATSVLREITKS